MFVSGCAWTGGKFTPVQGKLATRVAASAVLKHAVSDADRQEVAGYLYGAAVGLNSLASTNGIPSEELVRNTIAQYFPAKWKSLAYDIADAYALFLLPNIQANPRELWKWLEAGASGLREAAEAFMSIAPVARRP